MLKRFWYVWAIIVLAIILLILLVIGLLTSKVDSKSIMPIISFVSLLVTASTGALAFVAFMVNTGKPSISYDFGLKSPRRTVTIETSNLAKRKGYIPYLNYHKYNIDRLVASDKPTYGLDFTPWEKLEVIKVEVTNKGRGILRFKRPFLLKDNEPIPMEPLSVLKNGDKQINSGFDNEHYLYTLETGESLFFEFAFNYVCYSAKTRPAKRFDYKEVRKHKKLFWVKLKAKRTFWSVEKQIRLFELCVLRLQHKLENKSFPIVFAIQDNNKLLFTDKKTSWHILPDQRRLVSGNYIRQIIDWTRARQGDPEKYEERLKNFYHKVASGDAMQRVLPSIFFLNKNKKLKQVWKQSFAIADYFTEPINPGRELDYSWSYRSINPFEKESYTSEHGEFFQKMQNDYKLNIAHEDVFAWELLSIFHSSSKDMPFALEELSNYKADPDFWSNELTGSLLLEIGSKRLLE